MPMPLTRRTFPAALAVVLGLVGGLWLCHDPNQGEDLRTTLPARNDPAVEQGLVFDSEIAAVEAAWGQPIPDHLLRIGGQDEWSWAAVQITTEAGELHFFGEYRNHKLRYVGPFERVGGRAPIGARAIVEVYVLSHIDGTDLVLREIGTQPPRDYFLLRPVHPDRIEHATD